MRECQCLRRRRRLSRRLDHVLLMDGPSNPSLNEGTHNVLKKRPNLRPGTRRWYIAGVGIEAKPQTAP
ncbi:hypothetical protein AAHA92_11690 [Salvia divinorum]|uniref:Uncharacterized protein n=1 Tax=Salvia divinorum TaxID=28513 RepID=A0ABD1HHU3_SALDI